MTTTRAAPSVKKTIHGNGKARAEKKKGFSVLKFTLLPEFGRSFDSLKTSFALLINMVAQIFVMANIIPVDHPCANYKNASDYKLTQIIGNCF